MDILWVQIRLARVAVICAHMIVYVIAVEDTKKIVTSETENEFGNNISYRIDIALDKRLDALYIEANIQASCSRNYEIIQDFLDRELDTYTSEELLHAILDERMDPDSFRAMMNLDGETEDWRNTKIGASLAPLELEKDHPDRWIMMYWRHKFQGWKFNQSTM